MRHVFQEMLIVCEFLISIFTIISVEQCRSSIGCFCPRIVGCKCANGENLLEIHRDNVNCDKCTCNDLKVMCNLLVTALIIALSLIIVSGNVELNPGPMEKCPKCEKMIPTRFIVDVVIYYAVLPQGFCTLVHSLYMYL